YRHYDDPYSRSGRTHGRAHRRHQPGKADRRGHAGRIAQPHRAGIEPRGHFPRSGIGRRMSAAPATLTWFARHELTLAWRELIAMLTGGSRARGVGLAIFVGIGVVVLHLLAYGVVARWAAGGVQSDTQSLVMLPGTGM